MIPIPELQTLPSRLARLCLDVERFCRDGLKMADGKSWLLAVSGGADSTALLCIMVLLAPRHNWRLHVATVDHQLRLESAEDTAFVARLCQDWRIPCRILTADVARLARQDALGTEEAARLARYALLEQARLACGATAILLGHHGAMWPKTSCSASCAVPAGRHWAACGPKMRDGICCVPCSARITVL